jgi:hypothetical protein
MLLRAFSLWVSFSVISKTLKIQQRPELKPEQPTIRFFSDGQKGADPSKNDTVISNSPVV